MRDKRVGRGSWRIALLFAGVIAGIIALDGCTSTQLVNLWQNPSYTGRPLTKVLVIGLRRDPVKRRMWEDVFVDKLQERNVTAIASYQLFPNQPPDTAAIRETTKEEGFDGVLTVVRGRREEHETQTPGYTTQEAVTVYDPKWRRYATHYETVYHEGPAETSIALQIQTDLLLAQEQGRLLWSGTSETVDPTSPKEHRDEVARLVVGELVKSGMIP